MFIKCCKMVKLKHLGMTKPMFANFTYFERRFNRPHFRIFFNAFIFLNFRVCFCSSNEGNEIQKQGVIVFKLGPFRFYSNVQSKIYTIQHSLSKLQISFEASKKFPTI